MCSCGEGHNSFEYMLVELHVRREVICGFQLSYGIPVTFEECQNCYLCLLPYVISYPFSSAFNIKEISAQIILIHLNQDQT